MAITFSADGAEAQWSESTQQFGKFMHTETAKWAKVVQEAGIKKR